MAQVVVAEGLLEGELLKNEYGGQFYSFKGIPYAEPPVGDLRFKAPIPKKPWKGVRNAKEFGSVSIQFDGFLRKEVIGSEDCLYLNVYTPDLKLKTLIPVMIWIHGGGFLNGSGNDDKYGPEFLIRKDIILVTINYRVDALGFLSLDTEDVPGNAGMKDQVAAFRWVKKNIHNFGGDANNITIFGVSAGGASISYHLVSPMTKGLFNKAIAQSGALTCWWAQAFEPRERALKLAKHLGFLSEDNNELAEFFRTVPAEKLINAMQPIYQSAKLYEIPFGIVDEKDFGNERFFYGKQIEVLKKGIHENVKVLTGYTEHEGIVALRMGTFEKYKAVANGFKEFFIPRPIQITCSMKDGFDVARKVKEFYFKKEEVSENSLDQLISFITWDMFVHGAQTFVKLISKQRDVYVYKWTCKSERNMFVKFTGLKNLLGERECVSHGDDVFYLFPFSVSKIIVDKNSEAFKYIDRATTLWTNFAKFGNPTPDDNLGVKWTPYTIDKKTYLNIGNQLEVSSSPDAEEEAFWDSIFKAHLPDYVV